MMRRGRKVRLPVKFETSYIPFKGGYDTKTPGLEVKPGKLRRSQNWYQELNGGYIPYTGHERFDGRTKPSAGIYSILTVSLSSTVSVGDVVTDSGSASGTVIAVDDDDSYLVLSKVTGTFVTGTINVGAAVGTCTGPHLPGAAKTRLLNAQYTNLSADLYRSDITKVPGSGDILGITELDDVVYALRNNAGGTAAVLYKSSSSGWVACDLGETIDFNNGTAEFVIDETLTDGSATATIKKVIVTSGDWSTNDAAGYLVLYSVASGPFAAGVVTSASGSATATGANVANTLLPGGTLKSIKTNFTGSADTVRVYGCDGANRGFEWDGSVYVPIRTGMSTDNPAEIYEHKHQLFFSFRGSVQHSAPGGPYDWAPITGSSELAMGDTVTGFMAQPGSDGNPTMAIFTRNSLSMLYGSVVSDWNLIPFKKEAGAYSRSIQFVGSTFMLDDRGVVNLATSQAYGNFKDAASSEDIHDWIAAKRGVFSCSCISRDLNLYCLFFTDKTAIFVTIKGGKVSAFMPMLFPQIVRCVHSYEDSSGNEVIMFGDENGYVYQMFKGTSFDGDPIDTFMHLSYNNFRTPTIRKRYRRATLEVQGTGYFAFKFNYTLEYNSTDISQPVAQDKELSLSHGFWDEVDLTWDSDIKWDEVPLAPVSFKMGGVGKNMSLYLASSSDYCSPARVSGSIIQYTYAKEVK